MSTIAPTVLPFPTLEASPDRDKTDQKVKEYWGERASLIEVEPGEWRVAYVMGTGVTPWEAFIDAEMDQAAGAWALAEAIHRLSGESYR